MCTRPVTDIGNALDKPTKARLDRPRLTSEDLSALYT
jgi:hypothetical protein